MAVYQYRKFKISVSEDSKKTQGLHVGDIVRRQYFDNPNLIYSLMCVLETGQDTVTVIENGTTKQKKRDWFIGALLEGDVPSTNEILDFVRVTNLWDANRLGAIYMTSSDEQSPYIDVIDGIAVEQSLCYPSSVNNVSWEDNFSQYNVVGKAYASVEYKRSVLDNYRVCSITKNSIASSPNTFIGLSQTFERNIENPERVLVSYKIRASRNMNNIVASIEYEDETRVDGTLNVEATTEWKYQFHAITIDNSGRYKRTFRLNVNDSLQEGDNVEIADLNIILLSSVANFAGGMKLRIGKLSGVNDPVFGTLENYGAYLQRLYATQQVNISGTLTAGDENGFGCTFYAGKIHKNVVINSIACDFESSTEIVATDSPVGIGEVYKSNKEMILNAQTNSWMLGKLGKRYCFSFWAKSMEDCDVLISQNGHTVKTVSVHGDDTWMRYSANWDIQDPLKGEDPLQIELLMSSGDLYMTAPQFESGKYATQYQPTDDVLSYVEDYGAWFNKGGIGGTIQNPLLKLNEDGSISSKNDSFVIKNDGTGYFANGRFKWTKDQIILQGVTIKWEDLDDAAQEELKPKSIKLIGKDVFIIDRGLCSPDSLMIQMVETNFLSYSSGRKWYYLDTNGEYVLFDGENGRTFTVFPDAIYWKDRQTLTIKCVVTANYVDYFGTITIQKRRNGEDAYNVIIRTSNGNTFKNGVGQTTLTAHVYRGGTEITEQLQNKDFDWIKTSDNPDTDELFNLAHVGYGHVLEISTKDVWNMAQFDCKVRINNI